MLTDLDKLTGIDFSKKYVEINSYEDICYYDGLSCQQEMKEYADLEDYQDIENAEDVTDINFITSYVSHLIFGLGPGKDIAIRSKHIRLNEGLEILRTNLRVEDLKTILRKYNLKVSGKKNELISRIEENLSPEQIKEELPAGCSAREYILTKKGVAYVEKYKAHWYKRWVPPQFTDEDFIVLCEKNSQYAPEEILFCLLYHEWVIINLKDLDGDDWDIIFNITLGLRSYVAADILYDDRMASELLRKNVEEASRYGVSDYPPFY